jgi:hypothetical protein
MVRIHTGFVKHAVESRSQYKKPTNQTQKEYKSEASTKFRHGHVSLYLTRARNRTLTKKKITIRREERISGQASQTDGCARGGER